MAHNQSSTSVCPPPAVRIVHHYSWGWTLLSLVLMYVCVRQWFRIRSLAKPAWKYDDIEEPHSVEEAKARLDIYTKLEAIKKKEYKALARAAVDEAEGGRVVDVTPISSNPPGRAADFGSAMKSMGYTGAQATKMWEAVKSGGTLEEQVKQALTLQTTMRMKKEHA